MIFPLQKKFFFLFSRFFIIVFGIREKIDLGVVYITYVVVLILDCFRHSSAIIVLVLCRGIWDGFIRASCSTRE